MNRHLGDKTIRKKKEVITVVSLLSAVLLSAVSVTAVNHDLKYYMENSRNKQFINFKLCAILSSLMKSQAAALGPARDENHSFDQHIHAVYMLLTY